MRPARGARRGGGCLSSGARRGPLGGETAADDVDERPLGLLDVGVAIRELPEHPAGQKLLERPVEDPAREPRVEVGAEVTLGLAPRDDALDRVEGTSDLL